MTQAERAPLAAVPLALLAALKLALHLATNLFSPYGFHRDEFLYLAMGRHLQLWRMDFPPGIALVAAFSRATLGDSLLAIRMVPALAGTALLVFAALLARELGGGRFAQLLAALCVLANPLFLRTANLLQPVVLDQLAWTLALFALVRLIREPAPGWWLALGAAAGLGLLCKFSIAFIAVGILGSIILSPLRRALLTPWPWAALLLALAIGSPSLVGQIRLHFPVIGQMRDLRAGQLARIGPARFAGEQLLYGPATLVALGGLIALFTGDSLRRFRALGIACLAAFLLLLLSHGKSYYFGPANPPLIAAGAVAFEGLRRGPLTRLLQGSLVAALLVFGSVLAVPLGLPLLPPAEMAAFSARLGVGSVVRTNRGETIQLPQDYADMLGWEEQVRTIARVYDSLPPAERSDAVLFGTNYGEAGAIDFYGPRLGLPPVVSDAGSFWFFGPGARSGRVLIKIGGRAEDLRRYFDSVTAAAHISQVYAVPEERELTVYVATGPHQTLQEVWPSLRDHH